MVEYRN